MPSTRVLRVAIGLALGLVVAHRLLFQHGVVGLFHDWSIPPFSQQNLTFAKDNFDGWYRSGLGSPVVKPSEFPFLAVLAGLSLLGVSGEAISKAIVLLIPAIAFVTASVLGARLTLRPSASFVMGAAYALSPILFNKLVSGQSAYLLGYAVLPLVLVTFIDAIQTRPRFLLVSLFAAALVLCASEIQLGIIACGLVLVYALCERSTPLQRKLTVMLSGFALFSIGEAAVIVGTIFQGQTLTHQAQFESNFAWLTANSIKFSDVLRLSGYLTRYFDRSVAPMNPYWALSSWFFVGFAIAGIWVAPSDVRRFCIVSAVPACIVMTGTKGFFSPVLVWFFEHVSAAQVFRELYHLMIVLGLVYCIAIGFLFQRCSGAYANTMRVLIVLTLIVFVYPMLSGDLDRWSRAFPLADNLSGVYHRYDRAPGRVVWFPMDQPLAFEYHGAGVDPLGNTDAGSLWQYSLEWPLTAVDAFARDHDRSAILRGLASLSTGDAVFRKDFSSQFMRVSFYERSLAHYYRDPRQPQLDLGTQTYRDASNVAYPVPRTLPHAFAADAIAIAPARLAAIGAVEPLGYVPLPFGTAFPKDIPYVVVVDPSDAAAEATSAFPNETVSGFSSFDARRSFAPIARWFWYRPAYADVNDGLLAIGRHTLNLQASRTVRNAVLVVSWIATPVGGKVRVSTNSTHVIIDTYATHNVWRSAVFSAGNVYAGQLLSIASLDRDKEVAFRNIRIVGRREYGNAINAYVRTKRGATAIVNMEPAGGFTTDRRGTGTALPALTPAVRYRLTLTSCSPLRSTVTVNDSDGYVLTSAPRPRGCSRVALSFAGAYGSWLLTAPPSTQLSWVLDRFVPNERQLPKRFAVYPAKVTGTSVRFPAGHRVEVFNDAYNALWHSGTPAIHEPSALGTNVWISKTAFPPGSAARYELTPAFHVAFVLGLLAVIGPLFLALIAVCSSRAVEAVARNRAQRCETTQ